MALLGPARVLLGWEDGAPPRDAADGRRRGVRWGLPLASLPRLFGCV